MNHTIAKLTALMLALMLTAFAAASCSDEQAGGETNADTESAAQETHTLPEGNTSAEGETSATLPEEDTTPEGDAATTLPEEDTTPEGDTASTLPEEDTTPIENETADSSTGTTTPTPTVETIKLTFEGDKLSGAPTGTVVVEENAFAIVKPGTYELTGNLSNGQLRVRVADTERVTLIFNNFTASSSTTAPLYLVEADKVVIELTEGSVNRLTDAKTYQFSDPTQTKPNACLYAGCDLKIKGKGTLTVEGNYNNGIGCKKDLEITNGQITVTAPNNIVKGNNSVTVSGGKLTLSGGEDGIKSDEELKQGKGYILIAEDAVIDITCSDDALQATQTVTVEATAHLTISCGGDAVNCPGTINVPDSVITLK